VVAAGGIFDGRGIAAAFMLGGRVNMGTASSPPKRLRSRTHGSGNRFGPIEDAVKVEVLNDIQPLPGTAGYGTVLRSLRTPFMDEWGTKREEARRDGERLWTEIQARARVGRRHETLLTAGQTSGGIKEILPVPRSYGNSPQRLKRHCHERRV